MEKSKHTPGPWRTVTDDINHWVEVNNRIIMVTGPNGQANARLIAAAPDLLEALRYAAEVLQPHLQYDDEGDSAEREAFDQAMEAIKKAEGL